MSLPSSVALSPVAVSVAEAGLLVSIFAPRLSLRSSRMPISLSRRYESTSRHRDEQAGTFDDF
jgi:hypothetical protein